MSIDKTRRQSLIGLTAAPTALYLAGCSDSANPQAEPHQSFATPPKLEGLLVNRDRGYEIMRSKQVDALICTRPENIYYLTNYNPQLAKMGLQNLCFAILPLDQNAKPILILGQFEYYLAGVENIPLNEVDVRLFTFPADPSFSPDDMSLENQLTAKAFESIIPATHKNHALSQSEELKRKRALELASEPGVNSELTLIKAIKALPAEFKRLAIDSDELAKPFKKAEMDFSYANGDQILRDIRLQKTKNEIDIMRFSARANAEAGLAAAMKVRAGASLSDVRQAYYQECFKRHLKPSFIIVDGNASEFSDDKIVEGRSFLIDCVSSGLGYHGDYGRTVCLGEPTKEIRKATDAISNVWEKVLPELKPGITYQDIQQFAAKIFKEKPSDAGLNCNPHSVGLRHTDEPSLNYSNYFTKSNLTLMEGMVLSIDLPMVETGLGGSAHLEDLVLITKDGAELLNDGGDQVIIV